MSRQRSAGGAELTGALVTAWLDSHRSPNTRAAYGGDLGQFWGWCEDEGRIPLDASVEDVARYFAWCDTRGASSATLARRMSSLDSFFRFARAARYVDANPIADAPRPAVAVASATSVLDDVDAAALLRASDRLGAKTAALVRLLMRDGLRLGEVVGADVNDFDTARPALLVGRRGRVRPVPLSAPTARRLSRYLDKRRPGALLLSESPGRETERLTRLGADYLIKKAGRAARVDARVSSNALRRRYVAAAVATGAHVDDVRDQSGQRDVSTLQRYVDPDHNAAARACVASVLDNRR